MFAVVVLAGVCSRAQGQEDPGNSAERAVEDYLTDRGLGMVLGAQLRRRLAESTGPERLEVAERLGRLYVEQLAGQIPPEERRLLDQQSRDLLKSVPEADTFELRIDLSKASYLRAEEIAERERLRLASPEERQEAERVLRAVGPVFQEIAAKVNRKVEGLERREALGRDEEGLKEELGDARRLRSLAMYYSGWTNYYSAFLGGNPAPALRALEEFGWLLNAPPGRAATPDRLPKGLLKYEHVARAALGCAMCAAVRGNDTEAQRWLDAVEEGESLPSSVADQLFSRRLVVLGGARRWADLELYVRRRRQAGPLSPTEARLLAVITLEALADAQGRERRLELVDALAQVALGELVTQGQVGHVLDLVRRYGTAPIGDEGFVVQYVRGLRSFDKARQEHRAGGANAEEPAAEAGAANRYREAAWALERAVESPDAVAFGEERAKASMMLGLAMFYAGDLDKAAKRFEMTAGLAADPKQKQEALWFSIVAMDRAVEGGNTALTSARDKAATLYLAAFPGTDNAARLLLRRSGAGLVSDEETVRILLEIAPESALHQPARRQAAVLLFKMFRKARGDERAGVGVRFLDVAEEVLRMDVQRAVSADAQVSTDAVQHAVRAVRQIGEIGMALSPPEPSRVESALDELERLRAVLKIDLAGVEEELWYRRFQVAVQRGRSDAADEYLAKLRARSGPFAQAAERHLFRSALTAWRASPASVEHARAVVRSGVRVVEQFGAGPDTFQDPMVLGVYNDVAEAAAALWRLTQDTEARAIALRLDGRVVDAGKPPAESLRRLAQLQEAAGDTGAALGAWRILLAGMAPENPGWSEARYESLRLIAKSDPARAREVLDQHKVLYPDFGPEPWGSKLRLLDEELGGAPVEAEPAGKGDGG